MRRLSTRLRTRLILLALTIVVPAVLVVVYDQAGERRRARDRAVENTLRLVRLAAVQQTAVFDHAHRLLLTLSHLPELRDVDPARCLALLPNILRDNPGYLNIWIVKGDGSPFCRATPTAPIASNRDRAWFDRATRTRATIVGNYQISRTSGKPDVVVARPLLGPTGQIDRIVAAAISIDQLNAIAARTALPRGALLTLTDRNRTILARYPDASSWIGKQGVSFLTPLQRQVGTHDELIEAAGIDGVRRLFAAAPVAPELDAGLRMTMGIEPDTMFTEVNQLLRRQLWLLGLIALGAMGATLVGGQVFVLRPVEALKRVTTRLAAGDFRARAQLATGLPGLSDLEDAINAMAIALESHERESLASEERYRLLFERNPLPIWVCDLETLRFLEVNAAAVKRYGYTRDEFLAMQVTEIRPADEVDRLMKTLATPHPTPIRSEAWRHRTKSGEIIDVVATAHDLTFAGRPARFVIAQDVTERARAEAARAERDALSALASDVGLALSRPGSLEVSLQGCAEALVRHVNAACVRIWSINAAGQVLELRAGAGVCAQVADPHSRVPIEQFASGRHWSECRPYWTNEIAGDPNVYDHVCATLNDMVAFAGYPLVVEDRLVGVLSLFARHALSDDVIATLGPIADHVALGITRRQSEEARRLLIDIVEVSDDAIIGSTLDGTIISWNAGAEKLYGHSADAAFGQSISLIIPADLEPEHRHLLSRIRRGESVAHFETVRQRKDGSRVSISLTISPVTDSSGEVVAVSRVARDLTERLRAEQSLRDAEERMRFALEASRVGVWDVNLTTGVAHWSETCELMHGLTPGTFGGTFEAFFDPIDDEDRGQVRENIERATRDHTDAALEYRTTWPDGSVHHIIATGRFSYDEAGAAVRGAGITMDITARRSLEDQFRQAQKMEAVGQLAGGIAHDFNNMLTAILGNAEFLLDDLSTDDPRHADVDEIVKAGRRAAGLTHQLLAFSRKQMLAPQVIRLGDAVRDLSPMLRRLLGETIDVRIVVSEQGQVTADLGQMQQVLMNLALNARDAMESGGHLTIETADLLMDDAYARRHQTMQPGAYVMLAVSDTGRGMDARIKKRIFEPFFTTKPKGEGTGLGLATVYGIVKQSGGHIWVYSEVGHGTAFKVYLPRTSEADEPREAPSVDPHRLEGTETILLVEDEEAVREFVHKALSRRGYIVHALSSPRRAVEFAEAHRGTIHLILSDVILPDMIGPAMTALLARPHPEARVLYMSGYTDGAIAHHGVLDPDVAFLQKPFTAEALAIRVRDLLDFRPLAVR
jgi:PAS domain S-box-containing protein